jgi:hypothetical protein
MALVEYLIRQMPDRLVPVNVHTQLSFSRTTLRYNLAQQHTS